MTFLEKTLEDILFETPYSDIAKRGLHCFHYDQIARQFHLGSYGIADLVTFLVQPTLGDRRETLHRNICITVYELKQDKINADTFFQGVGYLKGLQELAHSFDIHNTSITYSLVLIGRTMDLKNNFSFTPDFFPQVSFYTYDYKFDGICFRRVSKFHRSNNTFSEPTVNRARNTGRELMADQYQVMAMMEAKEKAGDLPF